MLLYLQFADFLPDTCGFRKHTHLFQQLRKKQTMGELKYFNEK